MDRKVSRCGFVGVGVFGLIRVEIFFFTLVLSAWVLFVFFVSRRIFRFFWGSVGVRIVVIN